MAIASISGSSGQAGAVWAQLQQQQARRTVDQAEQKAQALRSQASDAQAAADRAQENARSLSTRSAQAQDDASSAQRNLVSLKSVGRLQNQFGELRAQLATALGTSPAASESGATTASAKPVVYAQGQTTGTLVSVTA